MPSPLPPRRYATRGVDREPLRLRIRRDVAVRLRAHAAASGTSVNAATEALLEQALNRPLRTGIAEGRTERSNQD